MGPQLGRGGSWAGSGGTLCVGRAELATHGASFHYKTLPLMHGHLVITLPLIIEDH